MSSRLKSRLYNISVLRIDPKLSQNDVDNACQTESQVRVLQGNSYDAHCRRSHYMDTPSVSSPSVSSPQRASRDFVEQPDTAFAFDAEQSVCWTSSADVKRVPSRDFYRVVRVRRIPYDSSRAQTAVHAASLLQDPTEGRRCDATEPVTEAAAKPKRRSIWKRTKRFVRRLFG